jgi:hypothetical protein
MALCLIAPALPTATWASTPVEKVVCTQAPRSQWLTEAQARAAFNASAYVLVRFKVSGGNCHEFYAIDSHGGVVEAYQHPVTGETVRSTRIAPPSLGNTTVHAQR